MLALGMATAKRQDEVRKLRDQAADFVAAGKMAKAVEVYLRLVNLEPGEGDWARRGADCYRILGKKKEQLELLLHAARAYSSSGQLLKGIAMCKLALAIDPAHARVQRELAALHEANVVARPTFTAVGMPKRQAPPQEVASKPPLERTSLQVPSGSALELSLPEAPVQLVARRPSVPPAARSQAPISKDSLEASLPPAPPADDLDLRGRLESVDFDHHVLPPESLGVVAIDVDDILIEELAPESEHLDLDHLGQPKAPVPETDAAEATLAHAPLFSDLDEKLRAQLIETVELVEVPAGRTFIRQGEPADAMYVVADGEVSAVATSTVDATPLVLAHLGPGEFFGEIGLLGDQPRQASIIAKTDAQVLRFGRDAIAELLDREPKFLRALLRFLRERLVYGIMLTSPLFTPFGPEDQEMLKRLFRFVEIEEGTEVIVQGSKADGLYVLLTGEAAVLRKSDESDGGTLLGLLGPGDVFGEMSLLQNRPAVATVVLRSKAYALKLPDRHFMQVLMTHPVMLEYVATLGAARTEENEALLANAIDSQPKLGAEDEHIALF